MKLLQFIMKVVRFVNQTPEPSRKTPKPMTRSARRAKKQLMRQRQAALFQQNLEKSSRPPLTKTEERLKKYHNDLESDLKKYNSPPQHIANLLDFMEDLEDPIIVEKP